jgi:6-phosphogluconolactonase/glucosamine-6-phosphate isomerase/deaminase
MRIYKIGIPEIAIGPLASKLISSLNLGPTLWLISGGSNIKISVSTMQRIDSELSSNLTIGLTDERFGPYNHPDSNWLQLMDSGFDPKNAHLIETLTRESLTLEDTVQSYQNKLLATIEETNEIIGQLGMGIDGHIAGILPNSVASQELPNIVTGYESQPYTRITLTFNGLRKISSAFLIAIGQDKHQQLDQLINQNLSLAAQPAQIIKQIPEAYIYNDQIEGKR